MTKKRLKVKSKSIEEVNISGSTHITRKRIIKTTKIESSQVEGKLVLLTTADLQKMFDVSYVTVYRWRLELGLPIITIRSTSKDGVRFDKNEVARWAFAHGKEILRENVVPTTPNYL